MATAKPKVIDFQMHPEGQFASVLEFLALPSGRKLKIEICSDSQRPTMASLWTENGWTPLAYLIQSAKATPQKCGYKQGGATLKDFAEDRTRLLKMVDSILS